MVIYELMDSLGLLGIIGVFAVLVIGLIFLFKGIIQSRGQKIVQEERDSDFLVKKHYSVDVVKYSGLIGNIALSLSIAFSLAAFEFPTFDEQSLVDLGKLDATMEEMIEIPPTEQIPPPPPKITQPEIIEVPDEEEIQQEIEVVLDIEMDQDAVIEEVVVKAAPVEEEEVDEIFEIVEESAEPIGGMTAFYQYVSKSIKYPNQAKRMGVEGRVYVQFVIEKDGRISDVKAIRGIGAGCDEEAVRVVEGAPKWKPGKQRGRPVKQRIVLPINFKLG